MTIIDLIDKHAESSDSELSDSESEDSAALLKAVDAADDGVPITAVRAEEYKDQQREGPASETDATLEAGVEVSNGPANGDGLPAKEDQAAAAAHAESTTSSDSGLDEQPKQGTASNDVNKDPDHFTQPGSTMDSSSGPVDPAQNGTAGLPISTTTSTSSNGSDVALPTSLPKSLQPFSKVLEAAGVPSFSYLSDYVPPTAVMEYVTYLKNHLPDHLGSKSQSTPFTMALVLALGGNRSQQGVQEIQPFVVSPETPFPPCLSLSPILAALRGAAIENYSLLVKYVSQEHLDDYLAFLASRNAESFSSLSARFSFERAFKMAYAAYPPSPKACSDGPDGSYPSLATWQSAILKEHGYLSSYSFLQAVSIKHLDDFLAIVKEDEDLAMSVTESWALKRALLDMYA